MLVAAAALLTITSVMSGVTGAPAVPNSPVSAVSDAPGVVGEARSVDTLRVLTDLSQLADTQVPGYLAAHPKAVADTLRVPPPVSAVSAWWGRLDRRSRETLTSTAPELVGNLDGIPYAQRTDANELELREALAAATARTDASTGTEHASSQKYLAALQQVERALEPSADGVARSLLTLDTTGDTPRAAIVIGDLSTARDVTVMVPGMFYSVEQQIVDWADTANALYDEQTGWAHRVPAGPQAVADISHTGTPAGTGVPGTGVAVVAWIGYHTPDLFSVLSLQLARDGANYLEKTLVGIRSLRQHDEPHLTVIGHSYGSTVAMMTLARKTVGVDALVLLGSPGSTVRTAASLDVTDDAVYVGQAGLDPVAHSAFFGNDPASSAFGATRIDVDGALDPITHLALGATVGHNGYFVPGTESMRNLALIGTGHGRLVIGPGEQGRTAILASGQ